MLPLVLIYLALILIFGVAGVFVWILRGHGFREFRRLVGRPESQAGDLAGPREPGPRN
jgi:hypothetical protein